MGPERTASRVAKLISNLSDKLESEENFPKPEHISKMTGLLSQYVLLVKALEVRESKQSAPVPLDDAEQIKRNGLPGAYEELFGDQ